MGLISRVSSRTYRHFLLYGKQNDDQKQRKKFFPQKSDNILSASPTGQRLKKPSVIHLNQDETFTLLRDPGLSRRIHPRLRRGPNPLLPSPTLGSLLQRRLRQLCRPSRLQFFNRRLPLRLL